VHAAADLRRRSVAERLRSLREGRAAREIGQSQAAQLGSVAARDSPAFLNKRGDARRGTCRAQGRDMRTITIPGVLFLFCIPLVSAACGGRTDQVSGDTHGSGSGSGSGSGTSVGSGSGSGTDTGSGSGSGTSVGSGSGSGGECTGVQPLCGECGIVVGADCTSDGWQCPPAPPCADAGGPPPPEDGGNGEAVPCGPSLLCDPTTSYCQVASGGIAPPDGGSDTSYSCLPFPADCGPTPSCACLQSNGNACTCTEVVSSPGPNEVQVTCDFP